MSKINYQPIANEADEDDFLRNILSEAGTLFDTADDTEVTLKDSNIESEEESSYDYPHYPGHDAESESYDPFEDPPDRLAYDTAYDPFDDPPVRDAYDNDPFENPPARDRYYPDNYDRYDDNDIDSGVMVDVVEQSPYLVKKLGSTPSTSPDSDTIKSFDSENFDLHLTKEEETKKAKCLLYCLKTYCVVFLLFVVSLAIYMAADMSGGGGDELGQRDEAGEDPERGYRELRLGSRRVYYRITEAAGMANHTVLLVHGDSGSGELFSKLGTMQFLRDHGARAVAIDVIGFGKSDPPMHILDSYEDFFTEIVSLFELEYNLILVCVEEGCARLLPYYLNHGVYRTANSFIEGAIFVSPRGEDYSKYVVPEKSNIPTGARTLVVSGGKDEFINMDINNQLSMIPRSEIHGLPGLKNNFYKSGKTKAYFHAALQAFIEGLEYAYDRELQAISDQQQVAAQQNNYQNGYNNPNTYNNQYQNNNPNYNHYGQGSGGYNNQQQQQVPVGGDLFSKFNAQQLQKQQNSKFQDLSYNPANRFSSIKGKRKK